MRRRCCSVIAHGNNLEQCELDAGHSNAHRSISVGGFVSELVWYLSPLDTFKGRRALEAMLVEQRDAHAVGCLCSSCLGWRSDPPGAWNSPTPRSVASLLCPPRHLTRCSALPAT